MSDADNLHTIKALKECVFLLEKSVRELLIYAAPSTPEAAKRYKGVYTSELVPSITRIGLVKIAERVEEIRQLVRQLVADNQGDVP